MFKILGGGARDCDGMTRRSFLQAGVLGLGGLALPDLLRLRASAQRTGPRRGQSVILFWLSGGPGHMETWDPKPDAPEPVPRPVRRDPHQRARRPVRRAAARAGAPDGSAGDCPHGQPRLGRPHQGQPLDADRLRRPGLQRPRQHRCSAGRRWARRSPGSRGQRAPGLPPYVAVPHLRGGTDNLFHYAAYLGGYANPFVVESDPNDPQFRVRNLTLPERRLARPAGRPAPASCESMDQLRRANDPVLRDLDAYYQRAFDLLTGKRGRDAFDIAAEPALLRDRYGRHTFGQSALLARRLVEAGAPFVTVNCVPWDHHGTPPQLKTEEGARKLIPPLDRAIAALIEDLIARGLYESTLVVAMGEFGRTPRMNRDAGRDHWGHTFSVLFGCGSMRMGQVIGRSSPRGEYVVDRPISPQDVAATVYHHLGIDGRSVTFEDRTGRPTYLIESGEPIRELVG